MAMQKRLPDSNDHVPEEYWQKHAACRGMDPDVFFPEGDGPEAAAMKAKAIATCEGCWVSEQCLEHSLKFNEEGIWAGMTLRERRAHRRRQQLAAEKDKGAA